MRFLGGKREKIICDDESAGKCRPLRYPPNGFGMSEDKRKCIWWLGKVEVEKRISPLRCSR